MPPGLEFVAGVFRDARRDKKPHQGEERETFVQVILIGDVALVGVPAEFFTVLGMNIKQRSPFPDTYVAELANDWIGYLPDREAFQLGGYQTWVGSHNWAEIGTGERMVDEAVEILNALADPAKARAYPNTDPEKHSPMLLVDCAKSGQSRLFSYRPSITSGNHHASQFRAVGLSGIASWRLNRLSHLRVQNAAASPPIRVAGLRTQDVPVCR